MTLIRETNRQYYIGAQSFITTGIVNEQHTATFDTNLVWATSDPNNANWPLNNFYLESYEESLYNTKSWDIVSNNADNNFPIRNI